MIWPKFEKKNNKQTNKSFPKEFFNEFWLIGREHEYIYIAEMKIGNFNYRVILEAKYFFSAQPKMLIYAN